MKITEISVTGRGLSVEHPVT